MAQQPLARSSPTKLLRPLSIRPISAWNKGGVSGRCTSQYLDDTLQVFVAIKRIYVSSSPARILNEIALMEDCRGCRHVAQLITAFREKDQIVAIIPFHRNTDFRVRCCGSKRHRLVLTVDLRHTTQNYPCRAFGRTCNV